MITEDGGLGGRMEAAQPCKGANRSEAPVQKCKGERQRFGWRVAASGGRWRECYQVSGLGSRVSGTGYQVRVRVRDLNLYLMPNT